MELGEIQWQVSSRESPLTPNKKTWACLRVASPQEVFITDSGEQVEEQGKAQVCSEAELDMQPLKNFCPDSTGNTAT